MLKNIVIVAGLATLVGCGGGSTSGDSLDAEREVNECASFSDDNAVVSNVCDFPIIVRTFAGSETPVTLAANSSAPNPDANIPVEQIGGFVVGPTIVRFGACRAPFTPVQEGSFLTCV